MDKNIENPQFLELTSIDDSKLAIYTKCSENELRHYEEPNGGLFLAESPKVIMRALAAGMEPVSVLAERKKAETDPETIEAMKLIYQHAGSSIPVYTAPDSLLTKLTGYHLTRGLLCAMKRPALLKAEEVLSKARRVAVLEHVANPTNIGAIFRSAAALSMDAVLLTADCSDPYYRRAARVSMGTVFQIPWTYFPKGAGGDECCTILKKHGFVTAALALSDHAVSIEDECLQGIEKLAVLLGAEGDGLSEESIHAADYVVKIPMAHGVDSLNVAAASAVAFWALR